MPYNQAMDIWNPDSLAIFLAFFIPGFISQTLPLLWWLYTRWQQTDPYLVSLALVGIFVIVPILLPIFWLWLRTQPFIRRRTLSPIKRPWDFVFNSRSDSYWVIVTFKSGEKLGGIYGGQSFSSAYPHKEQIYLQKIWVLHDDGTFAHEAEGSKGAIILSDEILTIELFSSPEGSHV
jgi:hypothetical protein